MKDIFGFSIQQIVVVAVVAVVAIFGVNWYNNRKA